MRVWAACVAVAIVAAAGGASGVGQEAAPTRRAFTVVASAGRFTPDLLEVARNDLVRITLQSEKTPHSFAIDAYRLMKRAGADETITFEFRADRAGRFTFYCNLSTDERCREMKGTLVVQDR